MKKRGLITFPFHITLGIWKDYGPELYVMQNASGVKGRCVHSYILGPLASFMLASFMFKLVYCLFTQKSVVKFQHMKNTARNTAH